MNYLKQIPTINQLLSNNLNLKINNHSLQHITYQEIYNNKEEIEKIILSNFNWWNNQISFIKNKVDSYLK